MLASIPKLEPDPTMNMLDTFCRGILIVQSQTQVCYKCTILQTLFKGKQISQIFYKVKYGHQGVEVLVSLCVMSLIHQ